MSHAEHVPVADPHESPSQAPHRKLAAWLRHWRAHAMTAMPRRQQQAPARRNFSATLRDWHKRAGLAAFIFMGWLGVSGVLLNESNGLGLDAARVHWSWLTSLYGLRPEPPQNGFAAGNHWLAVTADTTVLDGKALSAPIPAPLGFAAAGGASQPMLFVATSDSLVLLTPGGERIDELRPPTLPVAAIRRFGTVGSATGGRIAVQDLDAFQSADGGESWTPVAPAEVRWSQPAPLPEQERQKLIPYARPSVIVEQVLIDAHSGRLFGRFGSLVIDAVGFAALLLATSGVWMWWRASRRRQSARVPAGAPRVAPGMRGQDAGA